MTERRQVPWVWIGAAVAVAWSLVHWQAPLVEDSLFWWVPKGIKAGEAGFPLSPAGELPAAMLSQSALALPQWTGGLPDYGHPPLWYWWIGLFTSLLGPSLSSIKVAMLLPAAAAGAGFVALGQRIGSAAAGFAVFATPPFMAQLLRPELDLPLIALIPWALLALLDRAWGRFAVLSFIAVWCKEPGVLLVVPAVLIAWSERRIRLTALTPLLALGVWAAVHGWMATPERLPDGISGWLKDLMTVVFIVFLAQGRWLLFIGLPRLRQHPHLAAFAIVWMVFFSVVGFFANRGTADLYTHVRYLIPGLCVAVVLMARALPAMAAFGLLWLHTASPFGPEASLFGLDQARAEREAAPWIAEQAAKGERIWVGTHQAAGLGQPWAGIVEAPVIGFDVYSISTPAEAVQAGDIVIETAYGEPAGTILTGRSKTQLQGWRVHDAWVGAWRIDEAP
jgi:hypothetical protein